MSAPKFTPGPWKVDERNCHSGNIATVHGCTAGWVEIWSEHWIDVGCGHDVQDANIALIAAAPELYDACSALLDQFEQRGITTDPSHPDRVAVEKARAVLAKAITP